ncbi:MAG: sigma-70 family RNA polymerase sigma factor [Planctomycetaceae bacterium]
MSDQEESISSIYWPRTHRSLILRIQETKDDDPRREELWAAFLNLYLTPVRQFCLRRLKVIDEADEVTHLVFVRIFKSIPRFCYDPARGRFGGWVGQIARNEIIRFVHRKQRAGRLNGPMELTEIICSSEEAAWVDEFNSNLIRIAFAQAEAEVSPEHWQLFESTWKSEKKPGEVAKELRVPASRVHKARFIVAEKLKQIIQRISEDLPLPGDAE